MAQWAKALASALLWLWLELRYDFNPWHRNVCSYRHSQKKKTHKKITNVLISYFMNLQFLISLFMRIQIFFYYSDEFITSVVVQ